MLKYTNPLAMARRWLAIYRFNRVLHLWSVWTGLDVATLRAEAERIAA